jgi:hypothetical protein
MTERNWNFTVYEASLYRLRAEHGIDVADEVGGSVWYCDCGKHGEKGGSYPTRAQATARGHRHLRAAQRRIQREIEEALAAQNTGCGATWTTIQGRTYTCTVHDPAGPLWHSDGEVRWDGAGHFEAPNPD